MIISEKANMTYTAVPKNACTSMKCFFYHVNTGHDFAEVTPKKKMGYQGIHHVDGYRMGRFKIATYADYGDFDHAAIIRDPVDRFRSAYKNRLFQYNDIRSRPDAATRAKEAGLSDQPSLGTVIDNMEEYFHISNVLKFHLRPASFYLGQDLNFYSHLYEIKETDTFYQVIMERTGMQIAKIRANESHTELAPDYRLTPSQYDKLLAYTASDYELMKDHFYPRSYREIDWAQ